MAVITLFSSCLVLVSCLNGALFEPLESKAESNAAECSKLNSADLCGQVAACVWDGSACAEDPCNERVITTVDACNTAGCVRYNTDTESFCVTSSRKDGISSICSFEFGDTKLVEEGLCRTLSGCATVSPIEVQGATYFVCNKAPVKTDPCNSLTQEICPYIGKCMWEGDQCIEDKCWEQTYSSTDDCENGCTRKIISGSGLSELGYCKNGTHDLVSKCNAGTGTNFVTKNFACTGYPDTCNKIVTINNYEGGTLYVCNNVEAEFTVPSAALSLRLSTLALFAMILLTFSL